jgi:hypothetical protein
LDVVAVVLTLHAASIDEFERQLLYVLEIHQDVVGLAE